MSIGAQEGLDGPAAVPRPSYDVSFALRIASERLFAGESQFLARFAESLAGLVPQLRALPDQGRSLADGLGRAVLWAALTDDPVEVVEATFQNIGADYARRGFPLDGYHGAGHALLRAARDTYSGDWSSELSSGWVAYYAWLGAHLQRGAQLAAATPAEPAAPEPPPPGPSAPSAPSAPSEPAAPPPPADGPSAAPPVAPGHGGAPDGPSLDDVLAALRARYFPGDGRDLTAVLTRVALRSGADLRAPLPEQRTDPAVVSAVLAALYAMGYGLQPEGGSGASPLAGQPGASATFRGGVPGDVGGYV
jgi:hypothetical protein